MKRFALVLAAILLFPVPGAEAQTPKYAVASTGSAADAAVSDQAARAPYILIFDDEGRLTDVVEDRNIPARSAGAHTARVLGERGVTHFIAQRFGPNLTRALDQAGIECVEMSGPADEAVKKLMSGAPRWYEAGAPRLYEVGARR